jgi:2-keto-4-pentenoate hydratase/2-oxohepta-3-ene-1,7-dioic acid hydratase in catechol pathway
VIQAPPLLTFMTMVGQEIIGDGTIIGTGTLAGVGTHGMDPTGVGVGIIGTAQIGVGDGIIGMEIPGAVDIISRITNRTIKEQEVLPQ